MPPSRSSYLKRPRAEEEEEKKLGGQPTEKKNVPGEVERRSEVSIRPYCTKEKFRRCCLAKNKELPPSPTLTLPSFCLLFHFNVYSPSFVRFFSASPRQRKEEKAKKYFPAPDTMTKMELEKDHSNHKKNLFRLFI